MGAPAPSATATSGTAAAPRPPTVPEVGIRVMDGLYIGTLHAAQNAEWLRDAGITYIVNCTSEVENYFEGKGKKAIEYNKLDLVGMGDLRGVKRRRAIKKLDEILDDVLRAIYAKIKGGGKVLVHSFHALDRSPAVAIAYMTQYGGERYAEACAAMRVMRGSQLEDSMYIPYVGTRAVPPGPDASMVPLSSHGTTTKEPPAVAMQTIPDRAPGAGFPGDAEGVEITAGLYLGSMTVAQNKPWLIGAGIKCVVNCTADEDTNFFEGKAMPTGAIEYKQLWLEDNDLAEFGKVLDGTLAWIFERINGRPPRKVLVHCRQALSRSPAVVVAYMSKYAGMSFAKARAHVLGKRGKLSKQSLFWDFLSAREETTGDRMRLRVRVPKPPPLPGKATEKK